MDDRKHMCTATNSRYNFEEFFRRVLWVKSLNNESEWIPLKSKRLPVHRPSRLCFGKGDNSLLLTKKRTTHRGNISLSVQLSFEVCIGNITTWVIYLHVVSAHNQRQWLTGCCRCRLAPTRITASWILVDRVCTPMPSEWNCLWCARGELLPWCITLICDKQPCIARLQ